MARANRVILHCRGGGPHLVRLRRRAGAHGVRRLLPRSNQRSTALERHCDPGAYLRDAAGSRDACAGFRAAGVHRQRGGGPAGAMAQITEPPAKIINSPAPARRTPPSVQPPSRRCPGSSSCATSAATSRTTHCSTWISTWRPGKPTSSATAATCTGPVPQTTLAPPCSPSGRRLHRHQRQVSGVGGARDQRTSRTPRHPPDRNRPRRIYPRQSTSKPARRPAQSQPVQP